MGIDFSHNLGPAFSLVSSPSCCNSFPWSQGLSCSLCRHPTGPPVLPLVGVAVTLWNMMESTQRRHPGVSLEQGHSTFRSSDVCHHVNSAGESLSSNFPVSLQSLHWCKGSHFTNYNTQNPARMSPALLFSWNMPWDTSERRRCLFKETNPWILDRIRHKYPPAFINIDKRKQEDRSVHKEEVY